MKFTLGFLMVANVITYVAAARVMGLFFSEDDVGILLGSDKDEWGCIPTAGYVWCNETSTCIPINEVCANFTA
jgi:hypothetical protein